MRNLPFVKMHGLGNDFIVIDSITPGSPNAEHAMTPELAQRLCDRRFGIGADQVLWLRPAREGGDTWMEILNPDGSIAEMCGNGVRAAALYLYDHGPKPGLEHYVVETLGGSKSLKIDSNRFVAVDMGEAQCLGGFTALREDSEAEAEVDDEAENEGELIEVLDHPLAFFEVNMGNPHAVFFPIEDIWTLPLEHWGPAIEWHPRFQNRTNVELVKVTDEQKIDVRIWERGAGITLACGTGACASAVAAIATGRVRSPVTVKLPGGELIIRWEGPSHPVIMEGPAAEVFRGTFFLD